MPGPKRRRKVVHRAKHCLHRRQMRAHPMRKNHARPQKPRVTTIQAHFVAKRAPVSGHRARRYTNFMQIAALSGGDGWHARDLMRAATELGHTVTPVDFRRMRASVPTSADSLDAFDAVIVRTMPPGSLEQVVFRMDQLHAIALR